VVETKRKSGESFEGLIRRFNRQVQQSGRLIQKKKIQFHKRPLNRTASKELALKRKELSEKREYLIKTGKLKEDTYSRGRS